MDMRIWGCQRLSLTEWHSNIHSFSTKQVIIQAIALRSSCSPPGKSQLWASAPTLPIILEEKFLLQDGGCFFHNWEGPLGQEGADWKLYGETCCFSQYSLSSTCSKMALDINCQSGKVKSPCLRHFLDPQSHSLSILNNTGMQHPLRLL